MTGKSSVIFIICLMVLCSLLSGCTSSDYAEAVKLMEQGNYSAAKTLFEELGEYRDSADKAEECRSAVLDEAYENGLSLLSSGDYKTASDYFESLGNYRDSQEQLASAKEGMLKERYKDALEGDTVFFGSFEQDNDDSDGKEEIEWIVLEKQDDKLLLISRYALCSLPFNSVFEEVTWETSSMRQWLNSEFFDAAFSPEEKGLILLSHVESAQSKVYQSLSAGNATDDHVFLLGTDEAEKYFPSRDELQCLPTAYAVAKGAWTTPEYVNKDGLETCFWWLRTPGNNQKQAAYVHMEGTVNYNGTMVSYANRTARPVIWLDIS